MSIFTTLLHRIFGTDSSSSQPASQAAAPSSPSSTLSLSNVDAVVSGSPTLVTQIDIEKKMTELASQHTEKLNWKTSIVDLMKLVGMDSSLSVRKELAKDLHYSGNMEDSASMNIWLHKEVLKKLAENGGNVPKELLS